MNARFNFSDIEEHPLRAFLNNEFHARAPIPLASPALVSHLAFHHDGPACPRATADFVPATDAVAKASQTITFPAIPGQLTTNAYGLSASASSFVPPPSSRGDAYFTRHTESLKK